MSECVRDEVLAAALLDAIGGLADHMRNRTDS